MSHRKTLIFLGSTLLAALTAGAIAKPEQAGLRDSRILADFEESGVAEKWKTVNDNVMGGRSEGGPAFRDGLLVFTGKTNTNGGGFSSVRTESGDYDLSAASGLLLRVRGDGRTYKLSLRTDVMMQRWAVPFRADFETIQGKWQELYVPFESFSPSLFGQNIPNPPGLDPSKVQSLGFMIYDKKDGPFSLEVDWVKAVSRGGSASEAGSIVDRVVSDGRFATLAAALTKAELVTVLQGDGPFTVFAPTDKAFAELPKGTVEELLKPQNREKLRAILKYHVVAGETSLAGALAAGTAKTVQGNTVTIGFAGGRVRVNDAAILDADLNGSNGIIHAIDSVLLPPEPSNDILSVAKRAGSFTTLLAAVNAAGLTDVLAGDGPFTILAPTDEAFKELPEGTVKELLKKKNRDQLKSVLTYHAIAGSVSAGDALNAKTAKTLNGTPVTFTIADGLLKVNGATIRTTDIECDNGVIHVIDAVLLPASGDGTCQAETAQAQAPMPPLERIEAAIERGVPVFNDGNPEKCAEIYKECLAALAEDDRVDSKLRGGMSRLLQHGAGVTSDIDRAWLFRKGLDHIHSVISDS